MAVNQSTFKLNEELVLLLCITSEEVEFQAAPGLVLSLLSDFQKIAAGGSVIGTQLRRNRCK
jgi:hypothetical protein